MEEKVKRLEKENAQLKEAKKEAASHRSQMEKELKCLSKECAEYEEALRKAVEKAVPDCRHSKEGNNFLKAYWASRVDEFKKSDEYQQEVAKIEIPILLQYVQRPIHGSGVSSCWRGALVSGCENRLAPSAKPILLIPQLLLRRTLLKKKDLDSLLGEVEAEVRSPPCSSN
ncbi:UNVERIFIED_CONTAM: hypothetical protein Slati_0843100 [Sesamum latifolium]|uniref:Uncharacterized protein n=1 Tax=Sesamum latifolium TaxID=2727402 RepID=A0AAW2XPF3_9LAMI